MLKEEKIAEIELYQKKADDYSKGNQNPDVIYIANYIKNFTQKNAPKKVPDLACGTGRYLPAIKAQTLVGIDISLSMLKKVKIGKNISISRGDIFCLPFKDNCFDLVYSIGTLGEHVPLTNEIVSEVKRVLKPTGTFIFTTTALKHRIGIILIKRVGEKFLSKLSFLNNSSLHNWRLRFLTSRYANTKRSIYNTLRRHFQITHIENVESALHHYLVEAIPLNDQNGRGD